jgi:putative (di)nucleoside polyphosphate hydrolase
MSDSPKRRSDLPYRPNVGVMLIDRRGLVFVAKRIDQIAESWQMPQGGIDKGETPVEAAFRELKEEIGTNKGVILRELDEWLFYDLPDHLIGVALHGKFRGQKQRWLAMRFTGEDTDIDIATAEPEFSEWRWLAIDELPNMIVPFKRDVYARVISAFGDLAVPV